MLILNEEQCDLVGGGEVGATGRGDNMSYAGYYGSGASGCFYDAMIFTGGPMLGKGMLAYWDRAIECLAQ